MDKIITLTYANGTVTELSGVDELTAVMPLIVGGVATVSVRDQVPAPAPVPIPAVVVAAPVVAPRAPSPPAEPTLPGLFLPEPAATVNRRPRSVYLTENEVQIMRVIRQFPDGISSPDIAHLLDAQVSHTSFNVFQLRTKRPSADTTDPLVVKVSGGRFKATALGMRLKLLVAGRPMAANRELGWK
jgi:hypothetical protein